MIIKPKNEKLEILLLILTGVVVAFIIVWFVIVPHFDQLSYEPAARNPVVQFMLDNPDPCVVYESVKQDEMSKDDVPGDLWGYVLVKVQEGNCD